MAEKQINALSLYWQVPGALAAGQLAELQTLKVFHLRLMSGRDVIAVGTDGTDAVENYENTHPGETAYGFFPSEVSYATVKNYLT